MTTHIKVAGVWELVTAPSIKVAGAFKDVTEVWIRVAGVWKQTFASSTPLSVNVSPSTINKFSIGCPHTSASISASASGGEPSYSYAWTWQSGGSGLSINSPTSSSTTITQSGAGFRSGVLLMTVTDQAPDNATDTCSVNMECGT